MSNNNKVSSRVLGGVFFAVLLAVSGIASCSGGGGSTTVVPTSSTVSIFAASTSIPYNASTDITWSSTNSASCTSSGGGGTNATGTFNTGLLTATTTYTVTCGTASQSVTITVASSAVSSAITGFANAGTNVTVTSANTLAPNDTITIYGTTSYNGTFPVVSSTSTSFTIAAAFVANDATGVWQRAGGMISGCSTTGAAGITLSNIPSRFAGVAPLSVFFDASGTTATATTRPFHDLEYRWSFGEDPAVLATLPGGENWANGSTNGSRNLATGPVAAHVFETPGLYTVNLTATDGTNSVTNSCVQIAVQYPDAVFAGPNTICFSTSGTFTGACPTGATQVTTPDFVTAISAYQGTGKRLLFRRGEIFAAATTANLTANGPGIVGSFGTGAAPPVVQMTGTTTILNLSSRITPGISDWRVMDLEFNGLSKSTSIGVSASGGINQVTLLRLNIHDTGSGIVFSDTILDFQNSRGYPGHTIYDQVTIVDSSILRAIGGAGNVGVLLAGNRFSMLGNIADDTTLAEHVVRAFYLNKGVISNNTLSRQALAKLIIKIHGPTWCDAASTPGICTPGANYLTDTPPIGVTGAAGGYTEKVIISDNKLVSADGTDWTVNTGPQNAQSDERLRNIIVERNLLVAGNTTQVALVVNAAEETIRNNICNMTSTTFHKCVQVSLRGINSVEPPPANVRVYNNTFYSSSAGDFIGVDISAPSVNTTVYNNLGSAPSATVTPVLVNDAGTGTIQGNNLLNNSPVTLFVNGNPTVPADFRLPLSSPARDTGLSTIHVFSDFFRTSRPQSGVIDIGATEQ